MSKENGLVAVDFETYYDAEYSLRKMSVRNYLYDTRFNAYLVAVYDGDTINYTGSPAGFDWSLLDGMTICAHNASFDEQVYMRLVELGVIKRPSENASWLCTADMTAWLGVKRDLASASQFLLNEELSKSVREKMKGKTAEDCLADDAVLRYGNKDAITCYRLVDKYLGLWPEKERAISRLNREAGYRGMALDVSKVLHGIQVLAPRLSEAEANLPWVANGEPPLSANAAKAYGKSLGIPVPASFAKDDEIFIEWCAEYAGKYPWVKAMGEYRSINTLLGRVQSLRDGRILKTNRFPYGLKYFGASTGRFSGGAGEGAGRFNMQNMPRVEMYGVNVRPMFTAARGKTLLIADYNQIEARYLLWRVDNEAALAPMRKGLSVYQASAEAAGLAKPGSDIKHNDPDLYRYVKACLSPETLVLTSNGYKPIVRITPTDMVWDGQTWVAHEGVCCNGYRDRDELVAVCGGYATFDHKVYTNDNDSVSAGDLHKGWEESAILWGESQAESSGWNDVWTLAVGISRAIAWQAVAVCTVRVHSMWKNIYPYVTERIKRVHNAVREVWGKSHRCHKRTASVGTSC